MNEFQKWLTAECRRRGWGVTDLATAANAPISTAQGWLKAGSQPKWNACQGIADAFKVDVAFVRQLAGYSHESAEVVAQTNSTAPADAREEALLHVWRHGRPSAQRALEAIVELEAESGTRSASRGRRAARLTPVPADQAQR